MAEDLYHFIDGKRISGKSGRFGDVFNPATGDVTKRVPLASLEETRKAITSAHTALPDWSATPPAKRAQVLFSFRELLIQNTEELAQLLSNEHGKTVADAKGSITRGLEVVEFACGIPHLLKGEFSEGVANGIDTFSMRQPVGVCVGITPFNFPAMVPMWMFPVALACGNTFVLKPSEKDPSCGLRLAEIITEAGLPPGCLNVINGDKEAVDELLSAPAVSAVSFVGSTAIGQYIYENGCKNGKRVQALCGAKNHMIVLPDADMDQAVNAAMGAAYGSAGERCMAISVAVTVGEETGDQFVRLMAPRVQKLKVGPYNKQTSEMGPIINAVSRDKILDYIDEGISAGAKLVVDGRGISLQGYEDGFFIGGCLFDRVTTNMSIYADEIFGPVLCVVRANDFEHALKMVNDHEYGNGTAIFTRGGDAAREFTSRAEIGMIGINVPIPVPVAYHSFGGWKRSLFGDHHVHGMEGVRFYTRLKTVTTRWPSSKHTVAQYHFESGSD